MEPAIAEYWQRTEPSAGGKALEVRNLVVVDDP
jgi:hypothetical protein